MKKLYNTVTILLLLALSLPFPVVRGEETPQPEETPVVEIKENETVLKEVIQTEDDVEDEIVEGEVFEPVVEAVSTELEIAESEAPVSESDYTEDLTKTPLIEDAATLLDQSYVEGEILVKFKETKIDLETSKGKRAAFNFAGANSLQKTEDVVTANVSVLEIKDEASVEDKIEELKDNPNIEYVQPNYQYYPALINTNDTNRGLLWALDNTGQKVNGPHTIHDPGISDSDIDIQVAWSINPGTTTQVVVAVIDSGVAYNHPDLNLNMWDGSLCKDENGNPLGGCMHGYDYEDGDKIPLPTDLSHGTHIAGTIAAVRNNAKGIVGVAPYAKIMAIKTSFTTLDNVKSIKFATQNGAKIINASWVCYAPPDQGGDHITCGTYGGDSYNFGDQALSDAIANFPGLFMTAAGNGDGDTDPEGDDHEIRHAYPCDLPLQNIICSTPTDQNDVLVDFGDFGNVSVDVGAPGTNIYSTIADSTLLQENFENVVVPALPGAWTSGGIQNDWGTHDFEPHKVLYSALDIPYADDAASFVRTPARNLSQATAATISFIARCDTEYSPLKDYMELLSYNGSTYISLGMWDEISLDDDTDDDGPSPARLLAFDVPPQHFGTTTQFEFRWKTDAHDPADTEYEGCLIDSVEVTALSDGSDNKYGFMSGSSMSVPHVAGVAALLMGYGIGLSVSDVKNIILNSGDPKASLNGKTVSGKRINAQNALTDTTPPVITLNGSSPLQITKGYAFTDPGATAFDNFNGNLPVTVTGTVDTSIVGTYVRTYTASDRAKNVASTTRQVIVVDDATPPVITLLGDRIMHLTIGSSVIIPGATAFDAVDGDRTSFMTASGSVDTSVPGTYSIFYSVNDVAGNIATTTRIVLVGDLQIHVNSTAVTQDTATIYWRTFVPATSRLLWDTVTHCNTQATAAGPKNYGYPNTTLEDYNLRTSHAVSITNLTPGAVYFFRPVSLDIFGEEHGLRMEGGSLPARRVDSCIEVNTNSGNTNSGGSSSSGGGGGGGGGGGSKAKAEYTVLINNGASTANSTQVTLTLKAPKEAKQMKISNTSGFSSAWIPFEKTYTWTLAPGSGGKTVYVRFGANDKVLGNAKDTITLNVTNTSAAEQTSPSNSITEQTPAPAPTVSAGTSRFNFTQTLAIGARNQQVTELQKILIAGKYLSTVATGYYGQLTSNAVKAYQKAHGLPQTGVVDAATLIVLNKSTPSTQTANALTAADIPALQAKLAELIVLLQALKQRQ